MGTLLHSFITPPPPVGVIRGRGLGWESNYCRYCPQLSEYVSLCMIDEPKRTQNKWNCRDAKMVHSSGKDVLKRSAVEDMAG